ncbi:hypothetical protein APASM_3559 [Actinosynnema pretiosum subsp. pretiosum]|nr:hypothetical protein APASM_3559 [Actinosynnema pretiosum subsp. pretiosum]
MAAVSQTAAARPTPHSARRDGTTAEAEKQVARPRTWTAAIRARRVVGVVRGSTLGSSPDGGVPVVRGGRRDLGRGGVGGGRVSRHSWCDLLRHPSS